MKKLIWTIVVVFGLASLPFGGTALAGQGHGGHGHKAIAHAGKAGKVSKHAGKKPGETRGQASQKEIARIVAAEISAGL